MGEVENLCSLFDCLCVGGHVSELVTNLCEYRENNVGLHIGNIIFVQMFTLVPKVMG